MSEHFVSDHCVLCGGAIYDGDDWCADCGLSATSKGAEMVRRLRELERACKAIRGCKNLRLTVTAPAPEYQVWGDDIAAIGQLLEEPHGKD